ncbi:MAG TPA: GNAT family N-acetyltransferase [Chthoniobacterales bacterium]|nr:GNAT family N-acetyltransferase [Chthoniobacterales bacterium]
MTAQTENLIIAPYLPRYLRALLRSKEEFENTAGLPVADGIREQMSEASADFKARVEAGKQPDPWLFGFAIIHKADNVVIGTCGFPGPPDSNGVAEIAYGIAPAYQGRGYATEAAKFLIQFAADDRRVRTICAHTLAEPNASTRVLQKCGLKKVGEAIDPENGLRVWRWERPVTSE